MPLAAGARLGPYEILSAIGKGGMGVVYRARDIRLDRTVAIKVLPGERSLDPQNRERLLREARAISNLNHQHICTLHDIGSENGIDYLVMEYLEGQTFQQRLKRGPLPHVEALRLGIEIADALDRAHRDGIVHRDLKPGNIILTRSGAKLLDFGLAKMGVGVAHAVADETVTQALTSEGSTVGTLQYMAPEQLEGKAVDARTDVFAFGALLYEMLTGHRAFGGATAASVIASIITTEPVPAAEITGSSPLDRVIRKCLAKNPDRRWQTAADLRDELEWIASGDAIPAAPVATRAHGAGMWWWMAVAIAFALIVAWLAWRNLRGSAEPVVWNLEAPPPPDALFAFNRSFGGIAVSPDGRKLVFPVLISKGSQLWIRDLGSGSQKPLPGTEDGHDPFWSPESRHIAFFAGGKLKKIGLSGPSEVICNSGDGGGGSWNHDGVIIFTPRSLSVVHRVSAMGGNPVPITTFDAARTENAHYWPYFLPDGRHYLYWARNTKELQKSGIFVASLDDDPALNGRPQLLTTLRGAIYSPSRDGGAGHLLYLQDKALMARAFDPDTMRLSGDPIRVVDELASADDAGQIRASVSTNGVLVYGDPENDLCRLVWVSRSGALLGEAAPPALYRGVRISPDGTRIAFAKADPEIGENVWSIGRGGGLTRLTLEPSASRSSPVWSPDGASIAFMQPANSGQSKRAALNLFTLSVSGSSAPKQLAAATANQLPVDWSPDGRYLLYQQAGPATQLDLWALPLQPAGDPFPLLATPFEDTFGRISPDGRWLAYCSNESGSSEVYVQSFASLVSRVQASPRWTVSSGGGTEPVWRHDGKELFYRTLNGAVMSAAVESAREDFRTDAPKLLFEARPGLYTGLRSVSYDAAPAGDRFILVEPVKQPGARPLHVITNWLAAR